MSAKSPNRRDGSSRRHPDRVLSRGQFLALVASGAPAMLPFFGRRWLNQWRPGQQRMRGPVRNNRMVGVAEPQGTLLLTENGQGVEAEFGCRLNPVAREIWLLMNGDHSVEDIATNISRRFAIPYEVAVEDTSAFVDVMLKHEFFRVRA